MTIYSRADRTSNITSGQAFYEIIAGANPVDLVAVGIYSVTGIASQIGIGRSAVVGITPTSPQAPQANITSDPSCLALTAMAWSTGPTIPAHFFRRRTFAAIVGDGQEFSFVHDVSRQIVAAGTSRIVIPPGGSVCFWNILGGATFDVYVVIGEG